MRVNFSHRASARRSRQTGLYAILIHLGLVSDREQASFVLIAIAMLCLTVSALVWFGSDVHENAAPVVAEDSYRAGNPSEIDPMYR